ncbi:glycosyltransferase family A protein [Aequorivita todarodis]|uniref:glycosyltransferase family 2 protein n=1 Tax=Aequorivita todarodis TaxID=2036821 RepID=UPI002350BD90|nr:glycosyltransferase family A protein [Aequorivita todarodis]MDC8000087.1 glycosyltransferase family A protein [Aequorivita todarodis]
MLFHFLKYLQPTHYFQLYRKDGTSIFPIIENLPKEVVEQLEPDPKFKSEKAREYDLSWQAVNKGYIGSSEVYTSFEKLPVIDEYRFLRKYFHLVWVIYVLILRILSFKNPFREISAWKNSGDVQRGDYLKNPILYDDWNSYKSSLVEKNPFVSVVIPTLNRYEYLKDVLEDLEKQECKNFEVIIVDQSNPFQKDFYKKFKLDIKLVQQTERALWLARNHAIEISKGEYVLLFDDDSRVEPNWISNHLKCLDFFKADISSGVSISAVGAEVPQNYSFFRISDQIDTGNVLLKKRVFREMGLFDRQFEKQRMGDGEYGLRAYLNGYTNISNPYAGRIHLKVGSGGLREMGSWDAFRPKKLFAPRPIPSVLYLYRKYFGKKRTLLAILRTVPQSIIPYRYKKNKKMLVLGLFISLFLFPFVILQVVISWRLATRKLREGAMIESL